MLTEQDKINQPVWSTATATGDLDCSVYTDAGERAERAGFEPNRIVFDGLTGRRVSPGSDHLRFDHFHFIGRRC